MKTLVLYESKYGSTQKYAEDIAKHSDADLFPLKKFRWKNLRDYEIVVFGGYVRGGNVQGINDFLSHWDEMDGKAVIIFASGMGIPTKETRENLIEQNVLGDYHLRFYQLRGSFDYSKLKFADRLVFDQSIKAMSRDPESAGQANDLDWVKSNPIPSYDQERVDYICGVIQKIKIGEAKK